MGLIVQKREPMRSFKSSERNSREPQMSDQLHTRVLHLRTYLLLGRNSIQMVICVLNLTRSLLILRLVSYKQEPGVK